MTPARLLTAVPAWIGTTTLGLAEQTGGMALLTARLVQRLFPPRVDRVELVRNLHRMGVASVPIVLATSAFVGALMVLQSVPFVVRFGAKSWVGWGSSFTTLRELAPLLIALMFNGRVGSNNTAELASMVVTDQVDALRALAIDPLAYLVLPRVIAMVTMIFTLTILGDAVALAGAVGASHLLLGVHPESFVASMLSVVTPWDLVHGLVKSLLFGAVIGIASCHFGLSVRGGAPGVGRAVNAGVVGAAGGVFLVDYLATFVLR
jgi:phospholipid/cholesterol/gamma-HCH transport system permease protein